MLLEVIVALMLILKMIQIITIIIMTMMRFILNWQDVCYFQQYIYLQE